MKRFPILGTLLLIPALAVFVIVGCTSSNTGKGGDKGADKGADKGDKGGDKGGKGGAKAVIETAPEATLVGTVKINGKAPEMKPLADLLKHGDAKTCTKGDVKDQTWMVNNDGMVENVVIFLAAPADKKFKTDDNLKKLITQKKVFLDQPFCQYVPHVVGLYPEVQALVAKNSADVNHNVKIVAGGDLGTFDKQIPKGDDSGELKLTGLGNEKIVNVGCSIHSFMGAKVAVFNHPYFGVTDKSGAFKIEHIPVDTELTVYMWHESQGDMNKKVEQKKMSLKKGENKLDLEITP